METITRESVLAVLTDGWGNYVRQFEALSPQAQAAFLEKQGFARLADLLAHILAWWEVGLANIQTYKADPHSRQPEIDVDSFNAAAVEKARTKTEREIVLAFEEMLGRITEVVSDLPETDFQDARILNQLRMEFVGHLDDHKIQ
jgi:hypothetical protein